MKVLVKKKCRLPVGRCRIIKLSKDAMYELVWEYMCENMKMLFDLSNTENIELYMNWDSEKNICTCVAYNREEYQRINFDTLEKNENFTETSMFSDQKMYKEIIY